MAVNFGLEFVSDNQVVECRVKGLGSNHFY